MNIPTDFPNSPVAEHATTLADTKRLSTLEKMGLMNSLPEEAFDRITRMAQAMTGEPVSLLSFVDNQRQSFKSRQGFDVAETPLTHSFCQYVVSSNAPLVVADATVHPTLRENGAVKDYDVVAYLGVPVHGPEGEVLGSLCSIGNQPKNWSERDLAALEDLANMVETELLLRRSLSDRELVLEELNHRIKNMFAVVGGLVRMTLRESESIEEVGEALEMRMEALARAHNLIVPISSGGQNTTGSVSLNDLLDTLVAPYVKGRPEKVAFTGAQVNLESRSATNFALLLSELVTNAVKYGALAGDVGQLAVSWEQSDTHLHLHWTERGVAASGESSKDIGFGSKLIRLSVLRLNGELDQTFDAAGFSGRLTVPLASLTEV
ncbi:HWE histidine kinase domain-containing protein [Cognatiyoonia koreensis]|nr:HWE histidine kinase domain-containing protein [Cognatiyoonia koreensis]